MTFWNSTEAFFQFGVPSDCDFDFKNNSERVDTFLYGHISDKKVLQSPWNVFQLLLTPSHSQASVEIGFSVNSEAVVPNQE